MISTSVLDTNSQLKKNKRNPPKPTAKTILHDDKPNAFCSRMRTKQEFCSTSGGIVPFLCEGRSASSASCLSSSGAAQWPLSSITCSQKPNGLISVSFLKADLGYKREPWNWKGPLNYLVQILERKFFPEREVMPPGTSGKVHFLLRCWVKMHVLDGGAASEEDTTPLGSRHLC